MKYIMLGIIQGLTEFLPVSSSGHLVLFTKIFNMPTDLFFDAFLHAATALAVILYFRKDILELINGFFAGLSQIAREKDAMKVFSKSVPFRIGCLIIIGTFATAVIGISFQDYFEGWFDSLFAVGCFFFLTGGMILLAEWAGTGEKKEKDFSRMDALLIGAAQGAAIAPGFSRSGATISMALLRDLDRSLAARFSFLLSLPAIFGASLIQGKSLFNDMPYEVPWISYCLGFIAALISGYFAIKIFMNLIQRAKLRVFAYYCFGIGAITFIILSRS